jgi:hypothetical protein
VQRPLIGSVKVFSPFDVRTTPLTLKPKDTTSPVTLKANE